MKLSGVKVLDLSVFLPAPHLTMAEVEMVYEDDHAGFENGKIRLLSSPYKFNGQRLKGGISPQLGADTDELLG